jgi:hypothetical protein
MEYAEYLANFGELTMGLVKNGARRSYNFLCTHGKPFNGGKILAIDCL